MKKRKTLIASLAIMGTLLITAGVSYSLFTYSKTGLTENTIESGSIKFHYQEASQGLTLNDAMPMTDQQGEAQNTYFDFTITSSTSSELKVPYYITARRKGNDSSLDSAVRLYLTEVTNKGEQNESETALTLENNQQVSKFSQLSTYTNTTLNITAAKNEKVLYTAEVPKNTNNYSKDYRLRMWVDDSATYSQTETGTCSDPTYTTKSDCQTAGEDWTVTATAVQKEFTVTVNVYAEGESDVTPAIAPTIDSCPDCVFAYTTDTLRYIGSPTTLTANQYETNYQDVVAASGKNWFLGLKLDNSGTIEKAYACGIKDATPFCIEGSVDGSTSTSNNTLLNTLYGLQDSNTNLGCISNSFGDTYCDGSVNAAALASGNVEVSGTGGKCLVDTNGRARCREN